jgi:hypothetical protein
MSSKGGLYCSLLGPDCPRDDVESIFFLAYALSGEFYIFEGDYYAAQPEALEFAYEWHGIAERLWAEGKWKAHPQQIESGGLSSVKDGLGKMKSGEVRGVKLVYRIDETEWP